MTQNEQNYRDLLHKEIVLHTIHNGGRVDSDVVLNIPIPVIRDGHGVVYVLGINGDDGNLICENFEKHVKYLKYSDLDVNTLYDLHRAVTFNKNYKLVLIEW